MSDVETDIDSAMWLAVGIRGNSGDGLLYEVTRALFDGRLDLDFRSVQLGNYIREGDEPPQDVVIGPGAVLAGTFSSKKLQPAITSQWDDFRRARYHLWSTGLNFAVTEEEAPDVRRITRRTSQLYVRGRKEEEFFRAIDPSLDPQWAPCASLFTDKLLNIAPRTRDVVVVNFDSFLFTEENAEDHPLLRFKAFAEANGLEVRSMINGRPDLNDYLLDMFPMIEIDRPYLEPFAREYDSAVKFTKKYNQSILDHHSLGERYNDCRFAFGKRLHGWLPFMAFDRPSAFIGLGNRRGFPEDYFGDTEFLCDVPRGSSMTRKSLDRMADMMIDKLQDFINREDQLSARIAERRAELWEQLQQQSQDFVDTIREGREEAASPVPLAPAIELEPAVDAPNDSAPVTTILAFCESANQIHIADAAAKAWASWAHVVGVTFGRTFDLDPGAIVGASHLQDFVLLDRGGSEGFSESDAILGMRDWMSSLAEDSSAGLAVLSFNDGSRLAKQFVTSAADAGLPSFVIQDGFLGHETNITAASYAEFARIHGEIIRGERDLQSSMAEPALRKLYDEHASTTKIGASRECTYFVRGRDVAIKMSMRHGVRPEQIHVVGSVHSVLGGSTATARPDSKPSDGDARVLYVGQCHTLHRKIGEAEWLEISQRIFRQLGALDGAAVHYKFHPSEKASMRERLRAIIPDTVTIVADGVLTADSYREYDYVLTESSTALLEVLRAGSAGVVIEVPQLVERLPKVAPPAPVHHTTVDHLATDLTAIFGGADRHASDGTDLDVLEAPAHENFFGHIGDVISMRTGRGEPRFGVHEDPRARAMRLPNCMDIDVHGLVRRRPGGGAFVAAFDDPEILYAHLSAKDLAQYIPTIMSLAGSDWAPEFRIRLVAAAVEYRSPEYAVIADLLDSIDPAMADRIIASAKGNLAARAQIRMSRAAARTDLSFERRVELFFQDSPAENPDAPKYAVRLLSTRGEGLSAGRAVEEFVGAMKASDRAPLTDVQREELIALAPDDLAGPLRDADWAVAE